DGPVGFPRRPRAPGEAVSQGAAAHHPGPGADHDAAAAGRRQAAPVPVTSTTVLRRVDHPVSRPDEGDVGDQDAPMASPRPSPAEADGGAATAAAAQSAADLDGTTAVPAGDPLATGPEVPSAGVMVRVLGPVDVVGLDTELTSQQLSLLTFLACRGPAGKAVIVDALWDGQVISRSRFPNLLAELRARVGRHRIPEAVNGRYQVAEVDTDLAHFERLAAPGADGDGADDDAEVRRRLRAALDLVRGAPLTVPGPRFWTWVDDHTHFATGLEALVADVAARLARSARRAGDTEAAVWACRRGLEAAAMDQTLVSMLTELYVELGHHGSARRLVEGWEERISRLDCGEPSDEPRRRLAVDH
ncbi:MAG: hypothetical protein ACK5PP_14190, partial [Acidimicrobiales bacterium]